MIAETAVYEYSGVQRIGKTTLMVADVMNKLLNPAYGYDYKPNEVYVNFWLDIDGVNICNNEKMLDILTTARRDKWRHKVYVVDECSQPPLFYARNTRDTLQTELVTSLWQMPKLQCQMLYSSNIGNSVDIQMRDATWYSILPMKYHHNPERNKDYIDFRVVHGYEVWTADYRYLHPAVTQQFFDSYKPID